MDLKRDPLVTKAKTLIQPTQFILVPMVVTICVIKEKDATNKKLSKGRFLQLFVRSY